MVIDARNLAKWIKYNTCAQSTLGGQICFCPRISVLKKLMFEIEQFVGFEYSTIRSCTITLYFLQDRISFDYLRSPPHESSTTHENVFLVSPLATVVGSYLRYIERPTASLRWTFRPWLIRPWISTRKKERIDTMAVGGMMEERISSRSTNFGVKPTTSNSDSLPFSQLFSPPISAGVSGYRKRGRRW